MPKKVNHAVYRLELADKAAEVFRQHGYKGIGLREIAREVGVSKSALYHYFPSKEALFLACAQHASRLNVKPGSSAVRDFLPGVKEWEPRFFGDLRIMLDYLENASDANVWNDPVTRAGFRSMEASLAKVVSRDRIPAVLSSVFGFLLYRSFKGSRRAPYSILKRMLSPLLSGEVTRKAATVLLLFFLVSGVGSPAFAESPALTLEATLAYGLEHSPTARLARRDEDIARTQIGQAASLALPQVSLNAEYMRLDEVQNIDFGEQPLPMGTLDNYEVTAGVSQLLYSGGQVGAALRAARLARDYADASRRSTEAELVRDITVQFYGVLLSGAAVDVQEASITQLEAYVEQARMRKEGGAASEFESLTAQVRLANEKPKLIDARNHFELALSSFATLLNYPGTLTVTGAFEAVDLGLDLIEMEQMALEHRQELRGSAIRVGLGREAVVSARSEGLPSVRAFFNYHGANAYQFVSFDDEWDWHWNAGLVLNWNLWDGNLTRQSVRQKRFELEQLETGAEALRAGILLQVRQAWLGWVHAKEALAAGGDSVKLAERALEIAQARYRSGLSTYLELTDANLALSTARLALLKARHDQAVAAAQIRYVCGTGRDPVMRQGAEAEAVVYNEERGQEEDHDEE